jgi:hypothetical protein
MTLISASGGVALYRTPFGGFEVHVHGRVWARFGVGQLAEARDLYEQL